MSIQEDDESASPRVSPQPVLETPPFVFTSRREIIRTSGRIAWNERHQTFYVDGARWEPVRRRWREDVNTGWHLGSSIVAADDPQAPMQAGEADSPGGLIGPPNGLGRRRP